MRTISKILPLLFLFASCKKLVEIAPPITRVSDESAFREDQTAVAVLNGLYYNISNSAAGSINLPLLSGIAGLSADELSLWPNANSSLFAYYSNTLVADLTNTSISAGHEYWVEIYGYIFRCNAAIYGLLGSTYLSPTVRTQLIGEAKFMRAFLYFYLVNLYGNVPLVTGTDYEVNRLLPRNSQADVYNHIVKDLKEAKQMLSEDFLDGRLSTYPSLNIAERVRPTKWSATALLARIYLFRGEWGQAEAEASTVINTTSLFSLSALNDVFKKNSREAIWQLQPVRSGWNTEVARAFVLTAAPVGFSGSKPFYLSPFLVGAFENGDRRGIIGNWVNSYTSGANTYIFPFKYKSAIQNDPVTEYLMVFRLGEQYLIRAEARANLNNLAGAIADLNILRTRARDLPTVAVPNPLPDLPLTLSKDQVLDTVLHERQVELFTEWGHRWFDLKRLGKIDAVMGVTTPFKGGTWETTDQLFPIPTSDILLNPNLIQNPGY